MNILAGKTKYEFGVNRILNETSNQLDFESINKRLNYIENKKGNQLSCMRNIGFSYLQLSSKKLFVEKDIKTCRYYCYIIAKLEFLSKALDEKVFLDNSDLFYMLMSNNPDFIVFLKNNIEEIQPNDYNSEKDIYRNLTNTYGDFFITRTTLLAMIGDFEEVKKRCSVYLKKSKNFRDSYYRYRVYGMEFLKALALKDIEKMKETIDMMMMPKIAKALVKDHITNYSFYLHIYVIIYAKIALLHGFDLGIDNEVAPKEIIDNTPLESYEDPYDFMKKFDLKTVTPKEWREWTKNYSTFGSID
ncbi:Imm49 family immunity protein [Leptotrichia hofstadii]|uniref:Uncharacterized protein n=1 Tax=Leptotrichia hofstadii F0254 TaxID=634994 RepID=C9MU14_9FUSO|nr:Imm49 family immunity protein [Leptotrichia hofstadii]EEX75821.1 hypothetical protein GCWU000323_00032 [Leptotrichia hofstadii F0254]